MNAPSRFSPAEQAFDQMRREGTCVTASRDLKNAGMPVVPVDPTNSGLGAKLPPPKDDSMPDA